MLRSTNKRKSFIKRTSLVALAVMVCISGIIAVGFKAFASSEDTQDFMGVDKLSTVISDGVRDALAVAQSEYRTDSGNDILDDTVHSFTNSITKLRETLAQSEKELVALKSAGVENDEDRQNGIVKVDIDVASTLQTKPIDILFVLDQSGSMNMFSSIDYGNTLTTPSLDRDHYYRVPIKVQYSGTGTALDGKTVIYDYYMVPAEMSMVNDWKSTSFQAEIVANFKTELENLFSEFYPEESIAQGFSKSSFTVLIENRGVDGMDARYDIFEKSDDTAVDIYLHDATAPFTQVETRTLTTSDTLHPSFSGYYSPLSIEDGIDRMLLSKYAATELAYDVLESNPESRVGLITFDGYTIHNEAISSYDVLPESFSDTFGGDWTNYETAFRSAVASLNASDLNDGRERYVIFLTDGLQSSGSAANAAALAQQIKNMENTTLYSVGLMLSDDVFSGISQYASSADTALNVSDVESLTNLYGTLTELTSIDSNPEIVDVIGNEFDIFVDEDHPISMTYRTDAEDATSETTVYYTSLEDALASGYFRYTSDESGEESLALTVPSLNNFGFRMSFYEQIDLYSALALDSYTMDSEPVEYVAFPTNGYSYVSYTSSSDVKTTEELNMPGTVVAKTSIVSIEKSAQPADGEIITVGSDIEYTLTLKNNGFADIENVTVSDTLSSYLDFVSGKVTFDSETNTVSAVITGVPAGTSYDISFVTSVNTTASENVQIDNMATFASDDVEGSFADGIPALRSNVVSHTVAEDEDLNDDDTPLDDDDKDQTDDNNNNGGNTDGGNNDSDANDGNSGDSNETNGDNTAPESEEVIIDLIVPLTGSQVVMVGSALLVLIAAFAFIVIRKKRNNTV